MVRLFRLLFPAKTWRLPVSAHSIRWLERQHTQAIDRLAGTGWAWPIHRR